MNLSSNETSNSKAEIYRAVIPLMLLLCAISFTANVCILIAMRFIRTVFSPILILTCSLAAADTWAAFIVALGLIYNSYIPHIFGTNFDGFACVSLTIELIRVGGIMSTILHLLALAVVHYIATAHPISYRDLAKYVKRSAVLLWLLPLIALIVMATVMPGQAYQSRFCRNNRWVTDFWFRLAIFLHKLAPLLIMMVLYARIIGIVQNNKHAVSQIEPLQKISLASIRLNRRTCRKDSQSAINSYQRRVRATYTSVMILCTFVLMWMPVGIWYVITCSSCSLSIDKLAKTNELLVIWISVGFNSLMILKGLINAIIYSLRIPEIQTALKELVRSIGCTQSKERGTMDEISRLEQSPLMKRRTTMVSLPLDSLH